MAGLQVLPTTLIAAVVALFLTSEVGLIHTQQERQGAFVSTPDEAKVLDSHTEIDDGEGQR
jgi:hypothetical protein